jgi:hypothetical protein
MMTFPFVLLAGAAALAAAAQTTPAPSPAPAPATAPAQQPAAAATPTAPAAATPTVGAKVYDTAGAEVGTIASVTPTTGAINTGTNTVAIPLTSFGTGAKGLTIAMTRAQLDAAAAQATGGDLKAKLVAGTQVSGAAGSVLGTIKAADPQFVTVTTTKGADVKLPVSGFAAGPNGVVIGMTAEQLDAAIAGAKPQG